MPFGRGWFGRGYGMGRGVGFGRGFGFGGVPASWPYAGCGWGGPARYRYLGAHGLLGCIDARRAFSESAPTGRIRGRARRYAQGEPELECLREEASALRSRLDEIQGRLEALGPEEA